MIIELYGLPGAGKSTLAKALVEKHGFTKITLRSGWSVLGWLAIGFLTRPMWHLWLVRWSLQHNRSRFYFWNFYCHRAAKDTKARFSRVKRVVVDEGVLQNVLSYPMKELSESLIEQYAVCVLGRQSVVTLVPEESVRQEQLSKRAYDTWRNKQLPDNWQAVMQTNFERSLTVLPLNATVIRLTSSQDTDQLLAQLEMDTN